MKHILVQFALLLVLNSVFAQDTAQTVVVFDLKKEINPASTRITNKAVNRAVEINADAIIVHMNTYGGYVTDADSIRTRLLNSSIPTYVFIDNNAASAGALISLACDKIYMRKGSSIGATTVVNEDGAKAPDKYQSYMRKQMRSTAESHGMDTTINGTDTTFTYIRNPDIAEGMVDERVVVEGLDDSSKVITLTTQEALEWGYCEGMVENLDEILSLNNLSGAQIEKVTPSTMDKVVAFFSNPALRSVLILIMMGGIYFELQTPGVGFPIAAALVAAVAYFAPLYLDGLAQNWEILLFVVGIVLIALEIFVIPGFGVAGIGGILLVLSGLILSMIYNVNFDFSGTNSTELNNAMTSVLFAILGLFVILYFFGTRFIESKMFQRLVISDTIKGKVSIQQENVNIADLVGSEGKAHTALRPMGRIEILGTIYEAKTYGDFVDKGVTVQVIAVENGYVVVE